MSCQIRVVANILETEAIRRCLFPTDDERGTDNWLQQCHLSVSPVGDIIAIARERKLVVLTSKWDAATSSSQFQITYSGMIHEVDNVRDVLCLPIVGQMKTSQVSPDWTCILLGFESGYIRAYMETCELLYEEQIHSECIVNLKCQSQHNPRPDISLNLHTEEIYIQYQSNVSVIPGNQLIPLLRNYRAQLARVQANSELMDLTPPAISVRKWGFQDQSVINDVAVVGLTISNAFDHLLTASTFGGFSSKVRSMPPNNTLVIGAGSKPYLGFHYAIEGGSQPVLTDVAKAVANKLKSALPSWLTGSHSPVEKRPSISLQPADQMGCRFGVCDLYRTAHAIILSPDHKLAAVSDSFGRVILIDTDKGVALRILKGYRDAQCSFIQVPDERRSKQRIGNKVALFLVIYSSKKGTMEIFTTQHCTKITTFSASKNSRLMYISYGLLGFLQPTKSKYICQFTTVFIDNDGQIKEILIPFHFGLNEKNNKKARDIHLYKKLKHFIKFGNSDKDSLRIEVLNTIKELRTVELKSQTIELLITQKTIPVEVLLNCAQYFVDDLSDKNDDEATNILKNKVGNIVSVLNFYLFLTSMEESNDVKISSNKSEETPSSILKLEGKEIKNLQRLLDLSTIIADRKDSEPRVTFSDEEKCSPAEILSIFELSKDSNVELCDISVPGLKYRVAEALFKDFIGKCNQCASFRQEVDKSRIATKDLFLLLITYWVNRSLRNQLSLEREMNNLAKLLYILVKSWKDTSSEGDEIENFWLEIRDILSSSETPFLALTAAMLCKYVAYTLEREADLEQSTFSLDDEEIEIWSQENIEWTLLIGKLEDVTLLNILLKNKPKITMHSTLPKLDHDEINVTLSNIIKKKGSVSELVARWLSQSGIDPEYIVINDKINKPLDLEDEKNSKTPVENTEDQEETYPEGKIAFINSETLFEHFNMMRAQWPYSLEAGMILSNMSWEYAIEWKNDIHNLTYLEACISCLKGIPNFFLKLGLFNLVWKTHMKILFENTTKLLNKVGKVPKEKLCLQDTGLTDLEIPIFITICSDFLDTFSDIVQEMYNVPKTPLNFEPLWEDGGQPLAELAIQQTNINYDLLLAHYQLSLVFRMICTFLLRAVKPINNLFDSEVVSVFFYDFQEKPEIDYSRTDTKLTSIRIQFLTTVINSSVDAITVDENSVMYAQNHVFWMSKCLLLGMIWNLDVDVLRKQQVVKLFTYGYNIMASDISGAVRDRNELGVELLIIAGKRMKKHISASANLGTQLAALTPTVTRYMEKLNGDWCADSTLKEIIDLTTLSATCLEESQPEYKIAILLLEACTTLRDLSE